MSASLCVRVRSGCGRGHQPETDNCGAEGCAWRALAVPRAPGVSSQTETPGPGLGQPSLLTAPTADEPAASFPPPSSQPAELQMNQVKPDPGHCPTSRVATSVSSPESGPGAQGGNALLRLPRFYTGVRAQQCVLWVPDRQLPSHRPPAQASRPRRLTWVSLTVHQLANELLVGSPHPGAAAARSHCEVIKPRVLEEAREPAVGPRGKPRPERLGPRAGPAGLVSTSQGHPALSGKSWGQVNMSPRF